MLLAALLVALAFVLGAIPFGLVIARRRGVDIRTRGSGNIGATNVTRVLGPLPGLAVLVLDAAKGALPVAVAARWHGGPWAIAATGFAAIVGHCFSPLLAGKGGKGVATALGVFLVLAPELVPGALLVFVVVLVLSRVPALGSLAAIGVLAIRLIARGAPATATLACATLALLVYTHRDNLAKLRA